MKKRKKLDNIDIIFIPIFIAVIVLLIMLAISYPD